MTRLLVFGLGYSAKRIADLAVSAGFSVRATGRDGDIAFGDADAVLAALREADLVLSSIPPGDEGDPVLARYAEALEGKRLAYLSSTGVYGDTGGAWVDESAPIGTGRRTSRAEADSRWLALGARVFRLPGIYGPGRSAFERVASGKAHRIDLPGQVFSRVHVEDIAQGVMAGWQAAPGAYNLADDLPTSQNLVIEEACRLMGCEPPPLVSLDEAGLSPMARGFYAENRRVANGKARRVLGFQPRYPTYREGLRSLL
ncbi:MAG: NAD(P)-dependent oxidoreductase [Sphingomonadales bacterium 32-64-17]|nr:MAG: NAD(P)-dependent oxidoreductase [Sphingomonadales bacterium 32-64-17]